MKVFLTLLAVFLASVIWEIICMISFKVRRMTNDYQVWHQSH